MLLLLFSLRVVHADNSVAPRALRREKHVALESTCVQPGMTQVIAATAGAAAVGAAAGITAAYLTYKFYLRRESPEVLSGVEASELTTPNPQTSVGKAAAPSINLSGRRALIVGAAGGIGREVVAMVLRCGGSVLAADVSKTGLDALAADLQGGSSLQTLEVPIEGIDSAMAVIREQCAASPISMVVYCNGLAKFEAYFETSASEFARQYSANLLPNIYLTQVVAQDLARRKMPGSIVHVSSQSSTLALSDHLVYSSSKAALDHVARIQALELGRHGIRVNSVRPTVVLTELARRAWDSKKLAAMQQAIPLQRLATPEDVASTCVWLLSELSGMVTGAAIPVDGGRSMGGYGL